MRALSDVPQNFRPAAVGMPHPSLPRVPDGAVEDDHLRRRDPLKDLAMPKQRNQSGQATVRRTTGLECLLLIVIIVFLPLEDHIPTVAGLSSSWILWGIAAIYVAFNRIGELTVVASCPVAVTLYLFILTATLVESAHVDPSYEEIGRIGQMIAGAILVAAICRDRRALKASVSGFLIAGIWLSVLLVLTVSGKISSTQAGDFEAATELRADAYSNAALQLNLNTMAFIVSQGAAVSLAMALTTRWICARLLFLAAALLYTFAACLPFSRSGVIIVCATCGAIVVRCRGQRFLGLVLVAILGGGVLLLLPSAIISRMTFTMDRTDKMEGRARVYTAVIDHLPEYALIGVGSGNFWGSWGSRSEFFTGEGGTKIMGAHNCFCQADIYWGIPGLLSFLAVVWQAYRCVPRVRPDDALMLALMAIAFSTFLLLFFMHNMYSKQLSLGLGLLIGARCWGAAHRA